MFYVPELGRFLARDMIRRPGANPYVYTDSNPLTLVDPDGAQNQPVNPPAPGLSNITDYGGVLSPSPQSSILNLMDPEGPGESMVASSGVNDDLKARFRTVVESLKKLENLDVVVRRLATHGMVQEALKNCEIIYIYAHGSQHGPKHLSLYDTYKPGVPAIDWTKNMGNDLQSCTLASCEGSRIAMDLTKTTNGKVTFVGYTYDQVGQSFIADKLVKDLEELAKTFKGCPTREKKVKVCILLGQAGMRVRHE